MNGKSLKCKDIMSLILGLELLPNYSWPIKLQDSWKPNFSRTSWVWSWFFIYGQQINWGLSYMASHAWSTSKLKIRNIFKRQIWSSCLCILDLANRRPYKITVVYLSLNASVSHLNIFWRSLWCFPWFFLMKFHYFNT